jgi:outer membrane immunogenic protein
MKNLLLGTIGLVALGLAPASAADLAARPYTKAPVPMMAAMYDWSGFYLGLNGGWGSSRKCRDVIADAAGPVIPATAEGCHDATGGTAGGQIGYRWQTSSWVFGLEAQGNWADLKGSNVANLFDRPETRIDGIGLFTGQVGYAWNNVLLYAKGGAAIVSDRYRTFGVSTGLVSDSASETRWGGAAGAGVEFSFAPNWSVAFEYDHLFMGDRNVSFHATGNNGALPGSLTVTDRIRQDVDLATVRLNYRFGGPVIAKY